MDPTTEKRSNEQFWMSKPMGLTWILVCSASQIRNLLLCGSAGRSVSGSAEARLLSQRSVAREAFTLTEQYSRRPNTRPETHHRISLSETRLHPPFWSASVAKFTRHYLPWSNPMQREFFQGVNWWSWREANPLLRLQRNQYRSGLVIGKWHT